MARAAAQPPSQRIGVAASLEPGAFNIRRFCSKTRRFVRIDHIFGLCLEDGPIPMCETARVVRETPADASWSKSYKLDSRICSFLLSLCVKYFVSEELASDHCAVFVQMDFVVAPDVYSKEEVTVHQPLAG